MTFAPCFARAHEMPEPIRPLPPITNATLFLRENINLKP
jgi:hypothetical protein